MALPEANIVPLPTRRSNTPILLTVGVLLPACFVASLIAGSVHIPIGEIFTILSGGESSKSAWDQIILTLRLPRAITATLTGAALAMSGLQMQTLFRNPLAGPFVLGISSGASLGVALIVLAAGAGASTLVAGLDTFGNFSLAAAASIGAGTVLGLVLSVSRRVENNMTLLILGLMFGYVSGAMVSVLVYFSASNAIQAYLIWTFGSFAGVTWSQLTVFAPLAILGLAIGGLSTKALNALLLGETYAASLGLTVSRARFWILSSASLLAGVTTAFCGPIAFLGIAVPHLTRSILDTSDHRVLIPAVCVTGSIIALASDLIARVPGSQITLPLNAVTAIIGAPVVVWIVLRRRNLKSSFAS
jgi:iron complex transport system permease protein